MMNTGCCLHPCCLHCGDHWTSAMQQMWQKVLKLIIVTSWKEDVIISEFFDVLSFFIVKQNFCLKVKRN